MSLRLGAARLLMRGSVLRRELGRVAELTNAQLDAMLKEHAPGALPGIRAADGPMEGDLDQCRREMAEGHRRRVAALVEAMGRDEAVREGRLRMFPVGMRLGSEARDRLGVGDGMDDLIAAAALLYRVLGIEFEVERTGNGTGDGTEDGMEDGTKDGTGDGTGEGRVVLHIDRCALSEGYDEVTCALMSATDEGMVRGLNPRVDMEFRERMTAGHPVCLADLTIEPAWEG